MSKTLRQINVRDDLWTRVEALATRRGISEDEVVQAALVQLFSKKKSAAAPSREMPKAPRKSTPPPASPRAPTPQATPRARASARATGAALPRPSAAPSPGGSRLPPPGRSSAPAAAAVAAAPAGGAARPLYLNYEGQWYAIDQDQFVIGRGSKYSDLPIKDANISRRHAAVVRRGGEYFIKDLESTNGVEFHGERVDNHRIEEGSLYRMCDHEVRFSFIPPG